MHPTARSLTPEITINPTHSTPGQNLDLLRRFLRALPTTRPWRQAQAQAPSEFHCDHAFRVSGVGMVLAGAVHRGALGVGDHLLLGPDRATGRFRPVVVRCVPACV